MLLFPVCPVANLKVFTTWMSNWILKSSIQHIEYLSQFYSLHINLDSLQSPLSPLCNSIQISNIKTTDICVDVTSYSPKYRAKLKQQIVAWQYLLQLQYGRRGRKRYSAEEAVETIFADDDERFACRYDLDIFHDSENKGDSESSD